MSAALLLGCGGLFVFYEVCLYWPSAVGHRQQAIESV